MAGFQLTAQLNLRGPANIRPVIAGIQKQLQAGLQANVKVVVDKNASRQVQVLNRHVQILTKQLQQAAGASTVLANNMKAMGGRMATAGTQAGKAQQNIAAVGSQAAQTAGQVKMAGNAMHEFGRVAGLALRRFAGFTIVTSAVFGFISAVRTAVGEGISFEKQLIKISQVSGISTQGLSGLTDEVARLSTTLGVSSKDLINISLILKQAGLSARDTTTALSALAKTTLSPTFTDIKNTAEGAIAAMRQFGIHANQLEAALGSLNAIAGKFAVEADDLISVIRRAGGVFAAASEGIGTPVSQLQELAAIFTSVRATTRESASSIATGLRTIFTRIQRGQTINFLREYNIELLDMEGNFVGTYEAFRRLSAGLQKIPTRAGEFSKIVEELGGFRQVGKLIPAIKQFALAEQARGVAMAGTASLSKDAESAQKSLAVQMLKVREEFTLMIRKLTESGTFKTMATLALKLASAFIKVADSLGPILPMLATLMAFKGIGIAKAFGGGFFGGLKSSGGAGPGGTSGAIGRGLVPGGGGGGPAPSPAGGAVSTASQKILTQTNLALATATRQLTAANQKTFPALQAVSGNVKAMNTSVNRLSQNMLSAATKIASAGSNQAMQKQLIQSLSSLGTKVSALVQAQPKLVQSNLTVATRAKELSTFISRLGPMMKAVVTHMTTALQNHQTALGQHKASLNSLKTTTAALLTTQKNMLTKLTSELEFIERLRAAISSAGGKTTQNSAVLAAHAKMLAHGIKSQLLLAKTVRLSVKTQMKLGAAILASNGLITKLVAGQSPTVTAMRKVFGGMELLVAALKTASAAIVAAAARMGMGGRGGGLKGKGAPGAGIGMMMSSGGIVPGVGDRDTIPAQLTPGEFVIKKSATKRLGTGYLNKMNSGKVKGYAKGDDVLDVGTMGVPPFSALMLLPGKNKDQFQLSTPQAGASIPAFKKWQDRMIMERIGQTEIHDRMPMSAIKRKPAGYKAGAPAKVNQAAGQADRSYVKAISGAKSANRMKRVRWPQHRGYMDEGTASAFRKDSEFLYEEAVHRLLTRWDVDQKADRQQVSQITKNVGLDSVVGHMFEAFTQSMINNVHKGDNDATWDIHLGAGASKAGEKKAQLSKLFGVIPAATPYLDTKRSWPKWGKFTTKVMNAVMKDEWLYGQTRMDLSENDPRLGRAEKGAREGKGEKNIRGKTMGAAIRPMWSSVPGSGASGMPVRPRATGGAITDTVPAMLTPGEFVIRKEAAGQIGLPGLRQLNKGRKGFAAGGVVTSGRHNYGVAMGGGAMPRTGGGIPAGPARMMQSGNRALFTSSQALKQPIQAAQRFQQTLKKMGITTKQANRATKQFSTQMAKGHSPMTAVHSAMKKIGMNTEGAAKISAKSAATRGILTKEQLKAVAATKQAGQSVQTFGQKLKAWAGKGGVGGMSMSQLGARGMAGMGRMVPQGMKDWAGGSRIGRGMMGMGQGVGMAAGGVMKGVGGMNKAFKAGMSSMGGFALMMIGPMISAAMDKEGQSKENRALGAGLGTGVTTGAMIGMMGGGLGLSLLGGGLAGVMSWSAKMGKLQTAEALDALKESAEKVTKAYNENKKAISEGSNVALDRFISSLGQALDATDELSDVMVNNAATNLNKWIIGTGVVLGGVMSALNPFSSSRGFDRNARSTIGTTDAGRSATMSQAAVGAGGALQSMITGLFQGEAGVQVQAEIGRKKIAKDVAEANKEFQKQVEDIVHSVIMAGHSMEELGINTTDLTKVNSRHKDMLRSLVAADEKTIRISQRMRAEGKSEEQIREFEIRQGQKAAKVIFDKAQEQIKANKAAAVAAKSINLLNQALKDMAGGIKRIGQKATETDEILKGMFASISGTATIQDGGNKETIRILKDIRNSTPAEIAGAIADTSNLMGGGPAEDMMVSGIETSKKLENILPTFIQTLTGMQKEDRAQAIRDAFKGGGLLEFVPEEMRGAMEQALQKALGEGTRQGLTAGDIAQDPEKIASIIGTATEAALAPAIAAQEAAAKGRASLIKALGKASAAHIKVGAIYDKASKIQQDTNIAVAKALGKFENMSLGDMTAAFREGQERRTGMAGPMAMNPNLIARQIVDLENRRMSLEAMLRDPDLTQEEKANIQIDELNPTIMALNDNRKALERLSTDTSRLQAVQTKLAQFERKKQARRGILERLATAGPEELQNIAKEVNAALRASSTGRISARGKTAGREMAGLRIFNDLAGGRAGGGKDAFFRLLGMGGGGNIAGRLGRRMPGVLGGAFAAKGESGTEQELIGMIRRLGDAQQLASELTAQIMESGMDRLVQTAHVAFEAMIMDIRRVADSIANEFNITGVTTGMAAGGSVFQPMGTDTVPAMLTPGEFVVNRASAQRNLGLLQSINSGGGAGGSAKGGVRYYATGGTVAEINDEIAEIKRADREAGTHDTDEIISRRRDQTGLKEEVAELTKFLDTHATTVPVWANAPYHSDPAKQFQYDDDLAGWKKVKQDNIDHRARLNTRIQDIDDDIVSMRGRQAVAAAGIPNPVSPTLAVNNEENRRAGTAGKVIPSPASGGWGDMYDYFKILQGPGGAMERTGSRGGMVETGLDVRRGFPPGHPDHDPGFTPGTGPGGGDMMMTPMGLPPDPTGTASMSGNIKRGSSKWEDWIKTGGRIIDVTGGAIRGDSFGGSMMGADDVMPTHPWSDAWMNFFNQFAPLGKASSSVTDALWGEHKLSTNPKEKPDEAQKEAFEYLRGINSGMDFLAPQLFARMMESIKKSVADKATQEHEARMTRLGGLEQQRDVLSGQDKAAAATRKQFEDRLFYSGIRQFYKKPAHTTPGLDGLTHIPDMYREIFPPGTKQFDGMPPPVFMSSRDKMKELKDLGVSLMPGRVPMGAIPNFGMADLDDIARNVGAGSAGIPPWLHNFMVSKGELHPNAVEFFDPANPQKGSKHPAGIDALDRMITQGHASAKSEDPAVKKAFDETMKSLAVARLRESELIARGDPDEIAETMMAQQKQAGEQFSALSHSRMMENNPQYRKKQENLKRNQKAKAEKNKKAMMKIYNRLKDNHKIDALMTFEEWMESKAKKGAADLTAPDLPASYSGISSAESIVKMNKYLATVKGRQQANQKGIEGFYDYPPALGDGATEETKIEYANAWYKAARDRSAGKDTDPMSLLSLRTKRTDKFKELAGPSRIGMTYTPTARRNLLNYVMGLAKMQNIQGSTIGARSGSIGSGRRGNVGEEGAFDRTEEKVNTQFAQSILDGFFKGQISPEQAVMGLINESVSLNQDWLRTSQGQLPNLKDSAFWHSGGARMPRGGGFSTVAGADLERMGNRINVASGDAVEEQGMSAVKKFWIKAWHGGHEMTVGSMDSGAKKAAWSMLIGNPEYRALWERRQSGMMTHVPSRSTTPQGFTGRGNEFMGGQNFIWNWPDDTPATWTGNVALDTESKRMQDSPHMFSRQATKQQASIQVAAILGQLDLLGSQLLGDYPSPWPRYPNLGWANAVGIDTETGIASDRGQWLSMLGVNTGSIPVIQGVIPASDDLKMSLHDMWKEPVDRSKTSPSAILPDISNMSDDEVASLIQEQQDNDPKRLWRSNPGLLGELNIGLAQGISGALTMANIAAGQMKGQAIAGQQGLFESLMKNINNPLDAQGTGRNKMMTTTATMTGDSHTAGGTTITDEGPAGGVTRQASGSGVAQEATPTRTRETTVNKETTNVGMSHTGATGDASGNELPMVIQAMLTHAAEQSGGSFGAIIGDAGTKGEAVESRQMWTGFAPGSDARAPAEDLALKFILKSFGGVGAAQDLHSASTAMLNAGGWVGHSSAKGTADTIPAMLTAGEYVINRRSAQENAGVLESINSGSGRYRARGTSVGGRRQGFLGGGGAGGRGISPEVANMIKGAMSDFAGAVRSLTEWQPPKIKHEHGPIMMTGKVDVSVSVTGGKEFGKLMEGSVKDYIEDRIQTEIGKKMNTVTGETRDAMEKGGGVLKKLKGGLGK